MLPTKNKDLKIVFGILMVFFLSCSLVFAQNATSTDSSSTTEKVQDITTTEEYNSLRSKIDLKNREIEQLEQEIQNYKTELTKNSAAQKTLQGAIKTLETTRKKLIADLTLTEKKIDTTELSIEDLGEKIKDKQKSINIHQNAIKEAVIATNESDQVSTVESILSYPTLSDFWGRQSERMDLQKNMQERVTALLDNKKSLLTAKDETEKKYKDLSRLKGQLSDQKRIVDSNRVQTNTLLKDTKNKESDYKKQLAEREEKRLAVEKELGDYESQLKFLIDPSSYPSAGTKSLYAPLDDIFVTQAFGDTAFSRKNSSLYNGKGHNGVDFRAAPGTQVKSAFAGIVQGTGNTDIVCSGVSYGKWILIKHGNGLTTLYAHLSLTKVSEGDTVETGDLIGYSGNTGYSTGPHLHFGLFATQGVRITNLKSKACNGTYRVPVADYRAYLNPMSYI